MKYIKLIALGLIVLVASCKDAEKPVTKEQAALFADAITKAVIKKDVIFVNEAFDVNMLLARIKATFPNQSDDYWKGLKQGIAGKLDFGEKIVTSLGDKGRYNLLRQYEKDGKQHLLFRLYANYTINYHDFELGNKNGQTKIADVYIYAAGDKLSASMANIASEMAESKNEEAMYKMRELNKVSTYLQEGKYKKAKELIDELPVNLQSVKAIQLYHIQICGQISDSLHRDAIDKFQRDFPGDPSLDLLLVDGYFSQKKYAEALDCVNRLDRRVNTDPILDYYRGLLYNLQDNKEQAMQTLERLYKNMPDFSMGAFELSTYYMDKNQYEKAADIFKKIKQNRDYEEAVAQKLSFRYPKLQQYLKD